ncbi:535_t:CDS:2 [Acaulospora colombiana]|uniref:535_t:CDS:1 n=1 Tax=Acaulospora colombiana TaxID=27376 RepID=A0ACA9LJ60_9GLOM|nr:535_t:CDS:2 [Acaulospora colombiana]
MDRYHGQKTGDRLKQLSLFESSDDSNLYPPLTEQQKNMVKTLLTPDGVKYKSSTVVIEKFNLSIKIKDIQTLSIGSWLNDEIINFYCNLIMERAKTCPEKYPPIHIVNTFFYSTLMGDSGGIERLSRWFLKPKKKIPPPNLFDKKFIFIPINTTVHWTLAVANFELKRFEMYDSLGAGFRTGFLSKLKEFFNYMAQKNNCTEFDFENWESKEFRSSSPQQLNSDDCGVFAMITLEHLARQAHLQFSQALMPYFRERMIIEIKMAGKDCKDSESLYVSTLRVYPSSLEISDRLFGKPPIPLNGFFGNPTSANLNAFFLLATSLALSNPPVIVKIMFLNLRIPEFFLADTINGRSITFLYILCCSLTRVYRRANSGKTTISHLVRTTWNSTSFLCATW